MSEEGDSLRVRVLGPVEVEGRAGGIPLLRPSERALAVRLALAGGAAVPDATLAAELWGEAPANRPAQRLRVLASRLRAALGPTAVALTNLGHSFLNRALEA